MRGGERRVEEERWGGEERRDAERCGVDVGADVGAAGTGESCLSDRLRPFKRCGGAFRLGAPFTREQFYEDEDFALTGSCWTVHSVIGS